MKSKKFKKISKNIYEIKNALPERVAKKILAEFKNHSYKSWKLISQKKPTHYSHVFKNSSKFFKDDENNNVTSPSSRSHCYQLSNCSSSYAHQYPHWSCGCEC